jgi:AhpD family alkylhydroperoxidase
MNKNYPNYYDHLCRLLGRVRTEIPGTMSGFTTLHKNALAAGALSPKTKELIALGIAISVHCDGCISFHVHDALKAGATREEIAETVGVAVLMGGGPALMYGCEAMEALEQFDVVLDSKQPA